MDYVFIDTSVFEKNNFLEGGRINELLKLSEDDEIRVVLTQITYNEIISRFRKNVKNTESTFNTFRDKSRVLRNLPSKAHLFDAIEEAKLVAEFTKALDERLKRAKCIIIEYSKLDISEVFDKYFAKEPPFGEGQKKDEFPDAFALLMLEKWCAKHKRKCHVLSMDGDMLGYEHPLLIVAPDYEGFLDAKLRAKAAIVDVSLAYISKHEVRVETALINWVIEALDDDTKYTSIVNYMEVHSVTVGRIDVDFIGSKVVSADSDGVDVEVVTEVSFYVDVEIDDEETAYRDDDDKEIRYFDTTIARIRRTEAIPVLVTVGVSVDGETIEAEDLEIIEINEGRNLELKGERYWLY